MSLPSSVSFRHGTRPKGDFSIWSATVLLNTLDAMRKSNFVTRRCFIRNGLLASAWLSIGRTTAKVLAAVSNTGQDPDHRLKLGLTTYTLRKFSLEQAIAMTQEAGLKHISLKDMHLPITSTRAERQEAHKKIEAANLVLMGGGVISIKNNEQQ